MGDRGNVKLQYESGADIYLYTHWTGSHLDGIVARALDRGRNRWGDDAYLARIIFAELIRDDVLAETGYGISPTIGDGDDQIVSVNFATDEVTGLNGETISFADFIKRHQKEIS